ncbi:MAG: methionine--tRNA ligase [Candidatus Vogelbacteria bacterium]|nr:methionine--tRNA ligase [Candidatus Vogelbacteria bacterium]
MEFKPTIKYEDFEKLDIRIGTIKSAERVHDSKKLLKLTVDFDNFERQIMSGIARVYDPEVMIGKQCVFLVNLESRVIAGFESQGMILATHGEGDLPVLIHPEKPIASGSSIS